MKIFRSLLITSLFVTSFSLMAQPPAGGPQGKLSPEKREKVEAMKVAFITRKLNITPEEAKIGRAHV